MVAYTGTVSYQAQTGRIGERDWGKGAYVRSATTNATGDTITFSNPFKGGKQKLLGGRITFVSFDSNASPGTFKVGTAGDDDGFLTAVSMGNAGTTTPITRNFDGALVGTSLDGTESIIVTLGTVGTATTGANAYIEWFVEAQ